MQPNRPGSARSGGSRWRPSLVFGRRPRRSAGLHRPPSSWARQTGHPRHLALTPFRSDGRPGLYNTRHDRVHRAVTVYRVHCDRCGDAAVTVQAHGHGALGAGTLSRCRYTITVCVCVCVPSVHPWLVTVYTWLITVCISTRSARRLCAHVRDALVHSARAWLKALQRCTTCAAGFSSEFNITIPTPLPSPLPIIRISGGPLPAAALARTCAHIHARPKGTRRPARETGCPAYRSVPRVCQ
jgi:hypothetical protein